MNDQIDIRTKEIYLRTEYACGCVSNACPPPVACMEHDKPLIKIDEIKRESQGGKELKHSTAQGEMREIKELGVSVEDNLGEHWDDEVKSG